MARESSAAAARPFRVRSLVVLALLLGGCAPWSRAVLGPGNGYDVGMWTERGFELAQYRRGGGMQTLTRELARSDFHVEDEWSLVEYRAGDAGGESVSGIVLGDLRGAGGLDDAIEQVMASEDLFLAGHEDEARATLALPPAAPLDVTADGRLAPSGVQRAHVVTRARWTGSDIELVVTSSIVVTAWSRPCTGIEMPAEETVVDGVRWTRTYRLDVRGTILGVESSAMERAPPPAPCDPRIAVTSAAGAA
jgi:hypothetical protein